MRKEKKEDETQKEEQVMSVPLHEEEGAARRLDARRCGEVCSLSAMRFSLLSCSLSVFAQLFNVFFIPLLITECPFTSLSLVRSRAVQADQCSSQASLLSSRSLNEIQL